MLSKAGRSTVVAGPTINVGRICQSIEDLGQDVREVADAIDHLVSELDLRMDEQAELLGRQVDQLAEIAQTLRNPARTRAAERVEAAFELLRRHRNERALAVAEQAIDDDPNNDVAFVLAAWASLGIQDPGRARGYFREAAQATSLTEGQERRHWSAVHLAARLTFSLDGPEAALLEIGAANPFTDPGLDHGTVPPHAEDDPRFACLTPNGAAAIKFDQAVYHTAAKQLDAAREIFGGIASDHDARFCLMALTDPVLSSDESIMRIAQDTLRAHRDLLDNLRKSLPEADGRWQVLAGEIQRHEIRHGAASAAQERFSGLLRPGSPERQEFDARLGSYPNNHWLEEQRDILATLSYFESEVTPAIEYERMREKALEASVQDLLQKHRKALIVRRTRLDVLVGALPLMGTYKFWRLTVDGRGNVVTEKPRTTPELMEEFNHVQLGG